MRSTKAVFLVLATSAAFCSACAHSAPAASAPAASDDTATGGGDGAVAADDEAEPVPRFERVEIGSTGMAAYLPRGFPAFEVKDSDDGSAVHTAELALGRFHFVCIAARFKEAMAPSDDIEAVLTGYLDFLQQQLGIRESAGYGRGHRLDDTPEARGVIDYWKDKDGDPWAVKGWITPTHFAVLMVYGPTEYPYFNALQMYFGGVRFPPAGH